MDHPQVFETTRWLVGAAVWLAAHFLIFVVWFRHTRFATSEKAIFLFHLWPALLLSTIFALAALVRPSSASLAVAAIAIFGHGIYSLTFLELWTLAQISYSREVLSHARRSGLDTEAQATLVRLGDEKRAGRLHALSGSGMVRIENGRWSLTPRGRLAATLLRIVMWIPAIRSSG